MAPSSHRRFFPPDSSSLSELAPVAPAPPWLTIARFSSTDFRQFVEYGNLTGLGRPMVAVPGERSADLIFGLSDMALVQNSYLYHTRLDLPEFIEPGALQHMGENTIALLNYLTSPETTMGNSPTAEKLPQMATSSIIFFSGLGGHLFFVYSRAQGELRVKSIRFFLLTLFSHKRPSSTAHLLPSPPSSSRIEWIGTVKVSTSRARWESQEASWRRCWEQTLRRSRVRS
jgi:hypothetical protein